MDMDNFQSTMYISYRLLCSRHYPPFPVMLFDNSVWLIRSLDCDHCWQKNNLPFCLSGLIWCIIRYNVGLRSLESGSEGYDFMRWSTILDQRYRTECPPTYATYLWNQKLYIVRTAKWCRQCILTWCTRILPLRGLRLRIQIKCLWRPLGWHQAENPASLCRSKNLSFLVGTL